VRPQNTSASDTMRHESDLRASSRTHAVDVEAFYPEKVCASSAETERARIADHPLQGVY
jgi:hypothetical protein